MNSPAPRYRLYTSASSYRGAAASVFLPSSTGATDALEADLGRFVGASHVVCTPMARVAIHLVVASLVEPGREVILSPYTIFDVVNAVITAGARPVFADIDRVTCGITTDSVAEAMSSRTGAVMITHLHGVAAEVDGIRDLCRMRGVPMIEDAAQALGAVEGEQRLGTLADVGVYSFGMYKNVNAWFGGAIVTENADLASVVRERIRNWPVMSRGAVAARVLSGLFTDVVTYPALFGSLTYPIFRWAALNDVESLNRMSRSERNPQRSDSVPPEWQTRLPGALASLARRQLDRVDSLSRARIERAQLYGDILGGTTGISLPPAPVGLRNIYSYFPIQVDEREALLESLMRKRRDVGPQHLHNCADLEAFSEFRRACPVARVVARRVVLLPTYPRYPLEEARKTAVAVREAFR